VTFDLRPVSRRAGCPHRPVVTLRAARSRRLASEHSARGESCLPQFRARPRARARNAAPRSERSFLQRRFTYDTAAIAPYYMPRCLYDCRSADIQFETRTRTSRKLHNLAATPLGRE
jgi:hypothetical protein